MKYKEWLPDWLEHYMKPSIKPKTFMRYSEIVRLHLIPKLGDHDMDELSPIIAQKFVTELLNSGNLKTGGSLSASSVNTIIVVLQNSLRTAHDLGLVDKYEMDKIKRPKIKGKKIDCFTPEEQKKIEQAVMNDKREKMKGIIICLYTGLRIGELLALEWSDIDFQNSEISITKSCYDAKGDDGKLKRFIGPPKTETSIRDIPIPRSIVHMLKEMKKSSTSTYVINGKDAPPTIRSYQRSFELLLKKLNIPHRGFHYLRHTFATRAIECGMDAKTLSEILGHKSPVITLTKYAHSLIKHKRDMMNLVGKLL